MADDIVTRLRKMPWRTLRQRGCGVQHCIEEREEAADEIERLRAAGDALVKVMQAGSDAGWDAAIDAWQEARRG